MEIETVHDSDIDVLVVGDGPVGKLFLKIREECHTWYTDMPWFQRPDLSKEELFEKAEEMRKALDKIEKMASTGEIS